MSNLIHTILRNHIPTKCKVSTPFMLPICHSSKKKHAKHIPDNFTNLIAYLDFLPKFAIWLHLKCFLLFQFFHFFQKVRCLCAHSAKYSECPNIVLFCRAKPFINSNSSCILKKDKIYLRFHKNGGQINWRWWMPLQW